MGIPIIIDTFIELEWELMVGCLKVGNL
jgi:hypothetical protein